MGFMQAMEAGSTYSISVCCVAVAGMLGSNGLDFPSLVLLGLGCYAEPYSMV